MSGMEISFLSPTRDIYSYEYFFRLTRAGKRGRHMEDLEVYFPGPWVPVYSTRLYASIAEAADDLFGYWAGVNDAHSLEGLRRLITPTDLYEKNFKTRIGLDEPLVLVVECRSPYLEGTHEGTVEIGFQPYFKEHNEEEISR